MARLQEPSRKRLMGGFSGGYSDRGFSWTTLTISTHTSPVIKAVVVAMAGMILPEENKITTWSNH